eukprot:8265985-Alexandrium_andersonii.AAC.1
MVDELSQELVDHSQSLQSTVIRGVYDALVLARVALHAWEHASASRALREDALGHVAEVLRNGVLGLVGLAMHGGPGCAGTSRCTETFAGARGRGRNAARSPEARRWSPSTWSTVLWALARMRLAGAPR